MWIDSSRVVVPLQSNFVNTLHETTHGDVVSIPPYRPKSVQTVYQYADIPITPRDVGYGSLNKARLGILKNMLFEHYNEW